MSVKPYSGRSDLRQILIQKFLVNIEADILRMTRNFEAANIWGIADMVERIRVLKIILLRGSR